MNKDLTLVTAFYDIGRGANYDGRDCNKYLEYFEFLANIKNNLVVFTSKEFAEPIFEIRRKKGLGELTSVKVIEMTDFFSGFVDRVREIFFRFDQSMERRHPKNIECINPEYCCVNCLKPFYVKMSYELKLIKTNYIAWIDFGFNHGGEYYLNNEEFNFSLSVDKISKLFEMHQTDMAIFLNKSAKVFCGGGHERIPKMNIMALYASMEVPFIGGLMVGTQKGWQSLIALYEEGIEHFLALGAMDDDQSLLYYAYITNPHMFETLDCSKFFDSLNWMIPKDKISDITVVRERKKRPNVLNKLSKALRKYMPSLRR